MHNFLPLTAIYAGQEVREEPEDRKKGQKWKKCGSRYSGYR